MSTNRQGPRLSSARRRSGASSGAGKLGAFKLQSPLAASDAGSPCSTTSNTSALATPHEQSPLVANRGGAGGGATVAAAADSLAQFSQQLATSRSADRWLDETLASSSRKEPPRRHPSRSPLGPGSQAAVEPAASQIVNKALRFITGDQPPPPPPGATPPSRTHAASFDSQSFLDKGMDAISGVGKLMEGFALTLDSVIGQAFEDWGTPQPGSGGKAARGAAPPARRQPAGDDGVSAAQRPAVRAAAEEWGEVGAPGKENVAGVAAAGVKAAAAGAGGRQPHITSFMSKLDAASDQEVHEWRKRAQQLASELQRVRAQQEEYQRLRLHYDKLQHELETAASQASRLAQENSALKSGRGQGGAGGPGADPALGPDPLAAQQVARQMEALLLEKSKLVAENDRLLRENTGLQELLEFTLVHQAQLAGDGDLFGYEEEDLGGEGLQPAAAAGEGGAADGEGGGASAAAALPAAA